MAKSKSKADRMSDALDKVKDGLDALREVADEVGEARDNMSGTNLENTERYQRYDDAADSLSQACDDIESAVGDAEGVEL